MKGKREGEGKEGIKEEVVKTIYMHFCERGIGRGRVKLKGFRI